jgi:heme-degrading monooxygenase HmoA
VNCTRYGEPPYWAVIFAAVRNQQDGDGYGEAAQRMERLAARQPGYLGLEAARDADGFGMTVSYWESREAAAAWKSVAEHRAAQAEGRARWYSDYTVRVARVEEAYDFDG